MDLNTLGHIIRERRNALKLKQEALSERSHVAIKTIHLVELGKGNPSFKTLVALLDELGLDVKIIAKKDS
jgi:transcriptional regulator with XRE-family HTH domain